jgi:hypothetical protein
MKVIAVTAFKSFRGKRHCNQPLSNVCQIQVMRAILKPVLVLFATRLTTAKTQQSLFFDPHRTNERSDLAEEPIHQPNKCKQPLF